MIHRRRLLQGMCVILGSGAAAAAEPASRSGALTHRERDTVVAYAEVIVEGRTLSSEERAHLERHVEESAQESANRRALYETTARLLDRLAGGPFVRLGREERLALVQRHRLDRGVASNELLGPTGNDEAAVRTRALPDLIAGYWRSAAGWAAVGYATFPGQCGDLTRYTRPEDDPTRSTRPQT